MPWKECDAMSEREQFVQEAEAGQKSMSALCRAYGISRKTGYKWLRRYRAEGRAGLGERSRRPRSSPGRTPAWMVHEVVATRHRHPTWGGRKIRAVLQPTLGAAVPSASTITAILRRQGEPLQAPEKHRPYQRFEREQPNELWQMDFKGHFAYGTGQRCHPLTVLDDHSRYLLGLRACDNERRQTVAAQLTTLFRHYGLPQAMLVDNGSPWGTAGPRRFTRFSAWLVQLGITVHFIRPYHPQTLGKDERLHRTLKADLLQHQQWPTLAAWQDAFDSWRSLYNERRPHEALQLQPPVVRYEPSPRPWPAALPPVTYDEGALVRRVDVNGRISWRNRAYRVGKAFAFQPVALAESDSDGVYDVYFCHQRVTQLTLRVDPC